METHGFVVAESAEGFAGPTVVLRRRCVPERDCIRLRATIRTDGRDIPAAPAYRELLGSEHYLVAPVIVKSRVVALLHVSRRSEAGICGGDVDLLDAFASSYSLLHERMQNTELVQHQQNTIVHAAARLAEEARRIATATITLDGEADKSVQALAPTLLEDSVLTAKLSERECEVFEKLVRGASNADIADELVITIETVKTHVRRILRKIGAINRSEAIALYTEEAATRSRRESG